MLSSLHAVSQLDESVSLPDILRAIDAGEIRQISSAMRDNEKLARAHIVKAITMIGKEYSTNMSVSSVKIVVERIINRYFHLTIDDIYLFARNAIGGYFGKVYGSLSVPTLMEWLDIYSAERFEEIEAEQYIAHERYKENNITDKQIEKYWKKTK